MKKLAIRSLTILVLPVILATIALGEEEVSSSDSAVQTVSKPPYAGPWLNCGGIHYFVNPEAEVALHVEYKHNYSEVVFYLIDIKNKTVRKLAPFPPAILRVQLPYVSHAVLTPDGNSLIFDHNNYAAASKTPNGRYCKPSNPFGVQLPPTLVEIYAKGEAVQQNSIDVIPLVGNSIPRQLTPEGDFTEWMFDSSTQQVFAIACENGNTGVAAFDLNGKRGAGYPMIKGNWENLMKEQKASGTVIKGGHVMSESGYFASQITVLTDGSVITLEPDCPSLNIKTCVMRYRKNCAKPERIVNVSPIPIPDKLQPGERVLGTTMTATPSGKGLLLAVMMRKYAQAPHQPEAPGMANHANLTTSGEIWQLDSFSDSSWHKLCDIPSIPKFSICDGSRYEMAASSTDESVWLITERALDASSTKESGGGVTTVVTKQVSGGLEYISKLDLKTGKLKNLWSTDDLDRIFNSRKEPDKK